MIWLDWVYGISIFSGYLMPNSFLYKLSVLFQTVNFSRITQFNRQKPVLFQTIQFSISMQFSSNWSIDRALSGATTPGQNEPGSDGNERVLLIPQSSCNTGTSSSDYLVSYQDTRLGWGSYSSAEVQSVYSTAPSIWASGWGL